jgi:SpoVK/Ycf46/Vps4 family AAA+-type ATPase
VTASEVEKQLAEMFYMAHKWNCVMLLDEADVFLQARDNQNMERNAVVSGKMSLRGGSVNHAKHE